MSVVERWKLLGGWTENDSGNVFFCICRLKSTTAEDYEELMGVLRHEFSAVETERLVGPYSAHQYLDMNGFEIGVILDSPDRLVIYAKDKRNNSVMRAFVPKLLDALNRTSG